MEFDPVDMVKQLPDKINIPIGINNSASDPFDPATWPSTWELMTLLQGKAETILLITKEYVSAKHIELIESLDIQVIIFISYGGLPIEYEHLAWDKRLESLVNLKRSDIPTVLYARPIVSPHINDFDKIQIAADLVKYIVWSSVRVDHNNQHPLLPDPTGECLHKSHKRISNEDLQFIEDRIDNMGPIAFRKTSCAVSYINQVPDYNTHWTSPELYGCFKCPDSQRRLCASQKLRTPDPSVLGDILSKYGLPDYKYSVPGSWVLESNMKSFSCLRAGILRKITGYQVMFENPYEEDHPLITAEDLAYQHYELRGEKEGNIPL